MIFNVPSYDYFIWLILILTRLKFDLNLDVNNYNISILNYKDAAIFFLHTIFEKFVIII